MRTISSLPPASPATVRVISDRLLDVATRGPEIPSLVPALNRARLLIAQTGLARTELEERQVCGALEDVNTAVLHTLARIETS